MHVIRVIFKYLNEQKRKTKKERKKEKEKETKTQTNIEHTLKKWHKVVQISGENRVHLSINLVSINK